VEASSGSLVSNQYWMAIFFRFAATSGRRVCLQAETTVFKTQKSSGRGSVAVPPRRGRSCP